MTFWILCRENQIKIAATSALSEVLQSKVQRSELEQMKVRLPILVLRSSV